MTIQGWDSMILFYIGRMIVEWSCQISKADDGLFKIILLFLKILFKIKYKNKYLGIYDT